MSERRGVRPRELQLPAGAKDGLAQTEYSLRQGRPGRGHGIEHLDWGNRVRLLLAPFGSYPDLKIFKQWFVGQGILIPWPDNSKWTVEYSDIRSLSLEQVRQLKEVSPVVSDPDLYFAHVSFFCIRGTKEISASKAIEGKAFFYYRLKPETNEFEFQKFSCDSKKLGKRGKW